jgi:23S rRNA (cytosine1962-C5)-methyltransferase
VEGRAQDGAWSGLRLPRSLSRTGAYWPPGLICARLLTRGRDEIDLDFFVRRLERAVQYRRTVLPEAEAVRVVNGESDQLPGLVVDRYGDWLAVQVLTLGMEARSELVRQALERVLAPRGAVRVADSRLRKLEGLPQERGVWWGEVPERAEVSLGGFQVEVDLQHGQKTGLFLDQRENRQLAESHAKGKRVLDLFCYQGEWGLHAARGGAGSGAGRRLLGPTLAAARRMPRAQRAGRSNRSSKAMFDTVRAMERQGERFGLVILDPPALIKSRSHLAAGARAYRELNRAAMSMLNEGGFLITCSCSHQLEDPLFEQVLREAAREARRPFRMLDWRGEALDHPRLLAVAGAHSEVCAVLRAL